jgi:uncharacterized membrane protein
VLDAPKEQLGDELQHLMSALADRVLSSANDRVSGLTGKLSGIADGGGSGAKALAKGGAKVAEGKNPLTAGLSAAGDSIKSKVGSLVGGGGKGGKGGKGKEAKVTNIVEQIDIGAPVRLVYDQWTQFQDFSGFMKKVDNVEQHDDPKLSFKAQVLWSHRTWESSIVEQVPDKRIIWRSKGEKGHVDGAVTFHEIGPDLTRVLVVLEYHPQGLFERTGNLWRAQGRRVRLELKHFRRHVMTRSMLHAGEVDGWRGEIHDGDVTRSDQEARHDEDAEDEADEYDDEADEYDDEADEYDDEADEYDDEADENEDADEDDGAEHERPRRRSGRRPAHAGRRRSR